MLEKEMTKLLDDNRGKTKVTRKQYSSDRITKKNVKKCLQNCLKRPPGSEGERSERTLHFQKDLTNSRDFGLHLY